MRRRDSFDYYEDRYNDGYYDNSGLRNGTMEFTAVGGHHLDVNSRPLGDQTMMINKPFYPNQPINGYNTNSFYPNQMNYYPQNYGYTGNYSFNNHTPLIIPNNPTNTLMVPVAVDRSSYIADQTRHEMNSFKHDVINTTNAQAMQLQNQINNLNHALEVVNNNLKVTQDFIVGSNSNRNHYSTNTETMSFKNKQIPTMEIENSMSKAQEEQQELMNQNKYDRSVTSVVDFANKTNKYNLKHKDPVNIKYMDDNNNSSNYKNKVAENNINPVSLKKGNKKALINKKGMSKTKKTWLIIGLVIAFLVIGFGLFWLLEFFKVINFVNIPGIM